MNVLIRVLAGIGGHAQWEWGDGVQWGDGGWGSNRGPGGKSVGESWETSKGLWCGAWGVAKGAMEGTPFHLTLHSSAPPAAPLTDSDKGEEPASQTGW